MIDTTKSNVPDGFILLQTQNGTPKYAACMTGRLAGWLMKKYPDGNWVSERKLTNLEVMQAEDQRDDGIVHETPAATIQEPVMVAEPVVLANIGANGPASWSGAAPMVADPAGVALPPLPELESLADLAYAQSTPAEWDADYRSTWQKLQVESRNSMQWRVYALKLRDILAAATVKAVPSEALELAAQKCDELYAEFNRDDYSGQSIGARCCAAAIREMNLAAPLADKTGGASDA